MSMNGRALSARDARRNIGTELLESVRQVKAGRVGNITKVPASLASARPRYTMDELLAASDYSRLQAPDDREWVDAPAAGDELL